MPKDTPEKTKPTCITQVSFGLTVNVGNYENVRFELTAKVAPDEDWRDVLDSLRRKSAKLKDQILEEKG